MSTETTQTTDRTWLNRLLASIWLDAVYCFLLTLASIWVIRHPSLPLGIVADAALIMWTIWSNAALYHRALREFGDQR